MGADEKEPSWGEEPGLQSEAQTQGEHRRGEISGPRMVKESSQEEAACEAAPQRLYSENKLWGLPWWHGG